MHSISVRAYFKTLLGGVEKPQKEDVANYLKGRLKDFNFDEYPLDVTDSLAVAVTLVEKKANADINERIKELKKELKNAKSAGKQDRLEKEIQKLQGFLRIADM